MKCNITVGYYQRKLHHTYRIASSKCTCRLWNLGCYAANRVRNRLVTSVTCKNAWCTLDLTMNRTLLRLRLTSGATVWDHCVHAGGRHFEHMLRNYCWFCIIRFTGTLCETVVV